MTTAQLQLGEHVGPVETIERDFREFDRRNPHVYDELVRLARLWVERRGIRHVGVKTIYEVARWHLALQTEGDVFRLNNNFTALYARKLMAHEPDLDGLFFTRKLDDRCRCRRCV